jgi:hypothetical protein
LPGLETALADFEVDAANDDTIKISTGTVISIPKDCFVDESGNKVTGKVKIKYREFNDGLSIFLAGIPLLAKTPAGNKQLETGGMFEIRASQDNKSLSMAANKKIGVKYASFQSDSDYDFYSFNESDGTWELKNKPKGEVNTEKELKRKLFQEKLPKVKVPVTDDHFVLSYMGLLDVYIADYDKRQAAFESKAKREKFRKYGISLFDMTLINKYIKYNGTYYAPSELVWKKMEGEQFPDWVKNFQASWNHKGNDLNYKLVSQGDDTYKLTINEKKKTFSTTIKAIMSIKGLLKFSPDVWIKNYDEAYAAAREEEKQINLMAEMYRYAEVTQMGIYNYDRFPDESTSFAVNGTVQFRGKTSESQTPVYLFVGKESYIQYKNDQELTQLKLCTSKELKLVTILNNQELAIYTKEQFSAMNLDSLRTQTPPKYTFNLSKIIKVTSGDELRKELGI